MVGELLGTCISQCAKMDARGYLFCVFFCGIFGQVVRGLTETFYLDEICGNTIDMQALGIQSGRLLLRRSDLGLVNFNCVVFISAPSPKRLILKVAGLDIVAPFGCARDYIQFFDGSSSAEALSNGLCGYTMPDTAFISTKTAATVVFSKKLDFMSDQFEVIFTAHRKGPCQDGEYSCRNGLCIADYLYCDSFDNCGDGSDVCLLSVGGIVGIAIAVAVILILIALVVAIVIQRRRRRKLEKTYSFNGSSTLSLPRSRKDYSLPRSVKSSSIRDGTLPRSGKDYFVPREREDSVIYATVMKDKANHKIHILNAASLPRDVFPKGPEMDHVVSFRSYPAPVPKMDDEIIHSTPQPHLTHDGFFFGDGGKSDTTEVRSAHGDNPVSRNHSTKSSASSKVSHSSKSSKVKDKHGNHGNNNVTTEIPVHLGKKAGEGHGEEPMVEVLGPTDGLKDGHDIIFHNDTTDAKARDRDARGSFDLVRL